MEKTYKISDNENTNFEDSKRKTNLVSSGTTNNELIYLLKRILIADNVVDSITKNLNTLLNMIPEINDMIGFKHNHPHHHLDVWNHTLLALSISPKDFKIRLILLLHDIGKPHCYQDLDIRHFKGHAKKSSEIASSILNRLNFNQEEITNICDLISLHDDIISKKMIETNKALVKALFKIQVCDGLAHNPTKLEKRKRYLLSINQKINDTIEREYFEKLIINF